MSVPESRHQYVHENHRLERFIFADATTRAAGSGLLTPSGVPYTIVSDDIGQICYQTDTGVYYRLTGVGPLVWVQVSGDMYKADNLSGLGSNSTARTNLGLGSAATHPTSDFDAAGAAAAAQAASQPLDSDLTTISGLTATTNNFMQSKSSAWASRTPTQVTADLIVAVGDSGSGGTKGLVPAAGVGDAAAGKFLKADMSFAVPPGAGGGSAFAFLTVYELHPQSTSAFTFQIETDNINAYANPPANGDAWNAVLYLPAGAYALWRMCWSGPNMGIVQCKLDGTTIGSQDCYDPGGFWTNVHIGDITVSAGHHKYEEFVTGKNGSSSGYFLLHSAMAFIS